jgi:hypothetical protein
MRATISFLLALPLVLALPTIDRRQEAGVQRIADSWIVELEDDADLAEVLQKVNAETGVEAKSEYTIGGFVRHHQLLPIHPLLTFSIINCL